MKMSFTDSVSIVSTVIAVIALLVSIYTISITRQIATSGFQSSEQVKSETAQLIAVLRTIIVKGVVYSQQDKLQRDDPNYECFIDTNPERSAIEAFMHSSTALAYYSYIAQKSKKARNTGQKEEWRVFFLELVELRQTKNPWVAAKRAAKIEKLFDTIDNTEIEEISDYLNDLPKAINHILKERKNDPLMYVFVDMDDGSIKEDEFIEFVRYLREKKKIDDPELDVFWAASSGDIELLKMARNRGANLNIRSGELINRYEKYITEFRADHSSNDSLQKTDK